MSAGRTHFCTSAARWYGGVCWPSRYGLNGCIPAMTNSTVGSSATSEADGTIVCPCCSKYPRKRRAISADSIAAILHMIESHPPAVPGRPAVTSCHRQVRAWSVFLPIHIQVHALAHVVGEPAGRPDSGHRRFLRPPGGARG